MLSGSLTCKALQPLNADSSTLVTQVFLENHCGFPSILTASAQICVPIRTFYSKIGLIFPGSQPLTTKYKRPSPWDEMQLSYDGIGFV